MFMIDVCNRQTDKEAVDWPEERSQVGRWMWRLLLSVVTHSDAKREFDVSSSLTDLRYLPG